MIETIKNNLKHIELTYEDWQNGVIAEWKTGTINKSVDGQSFSQYLALKTHKKIIQNLETDYQKRTVDIFKQYQELYNNRNSDSLDKAHLKKSTINAIRSIFGIIDENTLTGPEKSIFTEYYNRLIDNHTSYYHKNTGSNDLQRIFLKKSIINTYKDIILDGNKVVSIEDFNKKSQVLALFNFLKWLEGYNKEQFLDITFRDEVSKMQLILFFSRINKEILPGGLYQNSLIYSKFHDSLVKGKLDSSIQYNFNSALAKKLVVNIVNLSKPLLSREGRNGQLRFVVKSGQFVFDNNVVNSTNWQATNISTDTDEYSIYNKSKELLREIKGIHISDLTDIYKDLINFAKF